MLLLLAAFAIALHISVFLDKKTIRRTYVLIIAVFLLSIAVFVEFSFADSIEHRSLRTVLMALRYSATPLIIAQIAYTLVKKQQWYVVIPAMIRTVIMGLALIIGFARGDSENDEGETVIRRLKRKFIGLVPAIGAVVAFLLTEDLSSKMVMTDKWTLLMIIIAVVQIAVMIIAKNKKEDAEGAQEQ